MIPGRVEGTKGLGSRRRRSQSTDSTRGWSEGRVPVSSSPREAMPMRVRVAAAVVAMVFCTLVVPRASDVARAEDSAIDAEAIVNSFVASLEHKKVSAAIAMMNPDVVDAVGARPAEAARLARTVADRVLETAAAEPKNAPAVAEIALRVGKKASATCPNAAAGAAPAPTPAPPAAPAGGGDAPAEGDAPPPAPAAPAADAGGVNHAARALAFGRLAVAATKAILGDAVKPDEWAAAMGDAKKIGAFEGTGEEDVTLAVETVLYAIDDEAPDEAALRGAADVIAFGRQKYPNSTSIADMALRT